MTLSTFSGDFMHEIATAIKVFLEELKFLGLNVVAGIET